MRNIVLATLITAAVLAGLAMPAPADDVAECKQLGYKPGTALFLQCLTLQQKRTQEQAQPAAGVAAAPVKTNWCANYRWDNAVNCYFETYEECRAAVSGDGGSCSPNPSSK
jgi:Protein of unknown function (DUF3551)